MNKRQFEQILKSGEGAMVEFKKTVSSSLGREISALANTAGGRIFIGIDDKNVVSGCELTNQVKSRVQDIANNCDPRVSIKIKSLKYKDKELIVITVPESVDKPIQCSEGFFLREGANSQKMTRNEIFYWAQKTRKIRYESQLREDFQYPEDFNEKNFTRLMKKMNVTITGQPEDMLKNLGLGENKKGFIINNAGIMLFGEKRRDLYIRQVYVTCVLYKGTNKVKIIDRKDFRDGLVQDYENAFKFLQQHLRLEYVIEGGRPREEIPEIPYEALKEALLNAIIHRDYFETGARVMVEIFDDRVEISNPGELLVDEKEFGKKVISVARNPVLFDIFHRLQLIEKVGTGVQRIIEAIQARKLSIEFYFGSFFSITFFRPNTRSLALSRHQVGTKSGLSWDQVGTKLGLSRDYVAKILEYCLEERAIADIMALFNRKNRTKFKEKFINPLLAEDFLTATSPKSKSSKQTYITTSKGKDILESKPKEQINDLGTKSGLSWDQVGTKLGLSRDYVAKILEYCLEERAIADIMALFNRKSRTKFRKTFINPLIKEDFLAMKIPVKPRSAKQKYVITERGKKFLAHINKKEQR